MKISYRSNIGIQIIESGSFVIDTENVHEAQALSFAGNIFNSQKEIFKPIRIISKTMSDVIISCTAKMIRDEVWNDVGECNGSIVMNNFTYCYKIVSNGTGIHDLTVFIFYYAELIAYAIQTNKSERKVTLISEKAKYLAQYMEDGDQGDWKSRLFETLYTGLIATINFLKYADVQDKEVKANSKTKGIDCKYINETNLDIHYITSNYITNIYVQGAFKVSGHWRLQPKRKEGKWTKELIWINEFEKEGYTRKAGITKSN
jgi:hypothetical protein